MLTDPASNGADAADSFSVVAPSLPGYTFSFKPGQQRFSLEQIADAFAELMTKVLGYDSFAAQGGDWGAFVTSRLGYAYPQHIKGIHLNLLAVRRDPKMLEMAKTKTWPGIFRILKFPHPGHQAADAGLWSDRFTGGLGGVAGGEVLHLDGLPW